MQTQAQVYSTKLDVKNDINAKIIPNSTKEITADIMRKILIGLWDYNVDTIWTSGANLRYRRGGITFTVPMSGLGGGSGTVTSITARRYLLGGTITTSGFIDVDTANMFPLLLRRKDTIPGGAYPYTSNPKGYLTTATASALFPLTSRFLDSIAALNGRFIRTETDPVFVAHIANTLTSGMLTNWNLAYNKRVVSISFAGNDSVHVLVVHFADGTNTQGSFFDRGSGGGGGSSFDSSFIYAYTDSIANAKQNVSDTNTVDATRFWVRAQNYLTSFTETDPLSVHVTDSAAMLNFYLNDIGYGLLRTGKKVYADTSLLGSKTFIANYVAANKINIFNTSDRITSNRYLSGKNPLGTNFSLRLDTLISFAAYARFGASGLAGFDAFGSGTQAMWTDGVNITQMLNFDGTRARIFAENWPTNSYIDLFPDSIKIKSARSFLVNTPTTSPGSYDVITRNTTTGEIEKISSSTYLTSFTESDPIANAKTITETQGSGILITGTAGQTLTSNPSWTFKADTSLLQTKFNSDTGRINIYTALSGYVPTSRTLTINGTAFDLSSNRSWSVGTVTSVATGFGLSGGTITGAGTVVFDSTAAGGFHTRPYNDLRYLLNTTDTTGAAMFIVAASDAPATIKKRADYVCDGTNDEVEIQAALALGNVQLTEGTFNISTTGITMANNRILQGVGDATKLVAVSYAITTKMIKNSGSTNILLKNFMIDGASHTMGYGIYFELVGSKVGDSAITGCQISNLYIKNAYQSAIELQSCRNSILDHLRITSPTWDGIVLKKKTGQSKGCINITIEGTVQNNPTAAVWMQYAENCNIINNIFEGDATNGRGQELIQIEQSSKYINISGNQVYNSAETGIWVNDVCDHINITGNTVYGSSTAEGIYCLAPNSVISNNTVFNNGHSGIYFENNGITISGNRVYSNSQSTNNTYNGIESAFSTDCSITNNIISRGSLTNKQKYGISITNSTRPLIEGNHLYDAGTTGDINTTGTTTARIRNNIATDGTWKDLLYTGAQFELNTGKLLGRTTASQGQAEEITVSTNLSLASGTLKFDSSTSATGYHTQPYNDLRYLQTEADAIALAKTITETQGSGILITGTATQALSVNPSWTYKVDTSLIATKYFVGISTAAQTLQAVTDLGSSTTHTIVANEFDVNYLGVTRAYISQITTGSDIGGALVLKAQTSTNVGQIYAPTLSSLRNYFLPDASGTIALTSQLPSGTNTGDVTLTTIGATPNANGASLSGQVLNLQPASASFGGVLTTGTQSIAGDKTFKGNFTWESNAGAAQGVLGATTVGAFSYGAVQLYNTENGFSGFFYTDILTASRSYKLPNASGTFALTSQITGTNSGTNTGDQNLFSSIAVSGQTTVTASSTTTGLTFAAGSNMTITTDNTTKTITFASTGGGSLSDADKGDIVVSSSGTVWEIDAGVIVNADINASAAIAYSKLNLTGAILNADLAGSIAYSKLSLTGAILNADLAGSINATKINTGVVDNTEFNYLDGVTSGIQGQLNNLQTLATTVTGLTAAGTNQGTALVLSGSYSLQEVTTAASGTGVQLPVATTASRITVVNRGANAIVVYPATSGIINGQSANLGYTLPANGVMTFIGKSSTSWYTSVSFQNGDVNTTDANGSLIIGAGKVTNAMLAGSISNANLANSTVTVNGTSIALGASGTVTAAAGTLTGATLNSTVTASSLTSVGSLTSLTMAGDIALGANNLTLTGSIGATGARSTKGWFTNLEITNMPTVGGTSLSSTFAPIASPTFTGTVTLPASTSFTTPVLGAATATSIVLSSFLNEAKGADIASATTTDIGAMTGNYGDVTGTTTITGLGTVQAGIRRIVRFTGALTLTHNATSLILPGAANITTVAGDVATFISLGAGNWRCIAYTRATVTGTGSTVLSASPTFTGTVTIPTSFVLGATTVTSTGTQLNYLNAATGTTGTTSTNLVYSTSPTLITPALGTPSALVLTNATGLPSLNKSISLAAPSSSETIDFFYTTAAITVTEVREVLRGSSPSVTYTINYGSSPTSATNTIVASHAATSTSGVAATLNITSIPAGSYIWITTSATSGTVTNFAFTMTYTQ